MDKYYVYGLIDSRNDELFYIGKGSNFRCQEHVCKVKNGNIYGRKDHRIKRILDSGGEVLIKKFRINMSEDSAYELETQLIVEFGRKHIDEHGQLLNITLDGKPPGMRGRQHSIESKEKMSKNSKGQIAWNKGKKMSSEVISNMSNAQKKRFANNPMSEETKLKMRSAKLGKKMSEEFCQKMRDSWKKRPRKLSDEHRQKIKDSWVRRKAKKCNESK